MWGARPDVAAPPCSAHQQGACRPAAPEAPDRAVEAPYCALAAPTATHGPDGTPGAIYSRQRPVPHGTPACRFSRRRGKRCSVVLPVSGHGSGCGEPSFCGCLARRQPAAHRKYRMTAVRASASARANHTTIVDSTPSRPIRPPHREQRPPRGSPTGCSGVQGSSAMGGPVQHRTDDGSRYRELPAPRPVSRGASSGQRASALLQLAEAGRSEHVVRLALGHVQRRHVAGRLAGDFHAAAHRVAPAPCCCVLVPMPVPCWVVVPVPAPVPEPCCCVPVPVPCRSRYPCLAAGCRSRPAGRWSGSDRSGPGPGRHCPAGWGGLPGTGAVPVPWANAVWVAPMSFGTPGAASATTSASEAPYPNIRGSRALCIVSSMLLRPDRSTGAAHGACQAARRCPCKVA